MKINDLRFPDFGFFGLFILAFEIFAVCRNREVSFGRS